MIGELTADKLREAYRCGWFPMADSATSPVIHWYAPDPRSVLPLKSFHVPKNVAKLDRQGRFTVTADRAFSEVIRGCAQREETWISQRIIDVYIEMFSQGDAHSIECWENGGLAGGLYGVSLGAAFFGESMFSVRRDASKIALLHLANRLATGGYQLLDIQMTTSLTRQFGAVEVRRSDYETLLATALAQRGDWTAIDRLSEATSRDVPAVADRPATRVETES